MAELRFTDGRLRVWPGRFEQIPKRDERWAGMVRSAILRTLQIDFSLQHFPYFSLQILKTLNKLTFGGPTVQTGLLPDPSCCVILKKLRSPRAHLSVGNFHSGRFACCVAARPGNGVLNGAVLQIARLSQVSGRHG
jgi:hypothetical protein